MARKCLLLALLLLATARVESAAAQAAAETTVRGRVVDTEGRPIGGATVSHPTTGARTISGADGRFRLRIAQENEVTLQASAMGHSPAGARAQQGEGLVIIVLDRAPHELPTVTVTGSTQPEIARLPGASTVIGTTVLRERAPVSVAEVLRSVPGIHAAGEDPFGLNLNVGFRGLPPRRSARTLLLEDGVPILLGPYGDPSMHYAPPVESLERIEVLKGSAQIENGPQTVGGVLNFVTRRPPVEGSHGAVALGGGVPGYRSGHLNVGTGRNGYGIALDLTMREGEGVRQEQNHRVLNGMLTGHLPLGEGHGLLLKGSIWDESSRTSETGLTQQEFEREPFSLPFAADGYFAVRRYLGQAVHEAGEGAVRLRTNAYLSSTSRASWRQSGESEERLGEDDYEEDFNCAPGAVSYDHCGNQGRPRDYLVAGVEPRLTIDFPFAGDAGALDVGLRLYRERVRRRQFSGPTAESREGDAELTRDNEIATRVVAGFVRTRLRAAGISLSPGVRVERIWQDIYNRFPGSEAEAAQSYTQILPGVGASYGTPAGVTLFAGLHRGFAPPRPADVYRPEPGQPVALLDPETSWNWEAGGRFEPRAGLRAEATLFGMDFVNQIVDAPAESRQRFINGGRTLHQGIEFSARASIGTLLRRMDDLTLDFAYTFLPVARFESGARVGEIVGNRLPYAPRHTASAGATYAHRSGVTLGAALEHTGSQFADDDNTVSGSASGQSGILPSYTVTNAFTSYSLPASRLQLRLSVHNLADVLYITQRNEGIQTGMRRLARAEIRWAF